MNSVMLDMLLKVWLSAGYSWDRCERIIKTWDGTKQKVYKQLQYEGQGDCKSLIAKIKSSGRLK